jgi:hypothetical protein
MLRFTIYVPAEMPDGNHVSDRWFRWLDWTRNFERSLAIEFGGFTRLMAFGGWKSPDETIITEPMYLYVIDVSESAGDFARAKVRQHAEAVKLALAQETVYTTETTINVFTV